MESQWICTKGLYMWMYCVWSSFKDEPDPGQKSVTSYIYSGHQLNIIMVK